MLSRYLKSQFVTKILTSPQGDAYRVVFLVSMVDGEVKAQVVSATLIDSAENASSSYVSPLCLPLTTDCGCYLSGLSSEKPAYLVSYFNDLFFFNSQPTRAPSVL